MNKSQLVDALADRLGDRRSAATAVDALFDIVVDTVRAGDSVSIAGFGVFESRARAARTGRNPRTGEAVDVPATTVPAFRPGTGFRSAVAGEAAPASTTPAPRRRRATGAGATNGTGAPGVAGATNGAGAPEAGAALNGAVELSGDDAAAVVATATTDPPAKATKSAKKTKADKAEKAGKGADAKDGKGKKKGKSKK